MFILNEGGQIRYQKRLDYAPSNIKIYHNQGDIFQGEGRDITEITQGNANSPCFNFMLGSFSQYLMVYKDVQLVWTCKSNFSPIYINIAKFD